MSDFKIVSILNPAQNIYNNVSGILDVSLSGNTDGVLADISTGTLYLAGGDNITLSQDGQSISIVGGAGGAGGGVAIAAGSQTATTNTIVFSNSNNVTFGMSGSTRVTASASFPAQTNQTVGLYASSNTYLTSSGTVDARSLSFRGDTNITVGVSAGEVVYSVGNYITTGMVSDAGSNFVAATAAFHGTNASGTIDSGNISISIAAAGGAQTAISGIVASDATYTSGTVTFSGVGGGVTVKSNTGQRIDISVGSYITTGALSGDTSKYVQNWKLTGNTAGTTSSAQGTDLWFSGGNSITVSGNSNTVVFSVGAYITTADLSANSSKYVQNWKLTGNTAGTTSSAQGTDLWFSGGNSITVSGNSNTIVFSVGAYLTTAMGSGASTQFVQANAGFNGTNASGTIASNSVSVSVAAPIPIATAVKAVASVGSTGTVTHYAPEDHQHAGVAAFAVTNTGNTAGNTRSQVGTFYIAASGAITASQSTAAAGNDTVWLSVAAQTTQSAIKGFGASNTGNTSGNTGISTGIDWVIAGTNAVTISESTTAGGPNTLWVNAPNAAAGNVTFSAGANSSGLASVIFSNSNGVSFGLGAGSVITASVNAGGGGGVGIGITNSGNTAGTSGTVTTGNYYLVGSGAITLSQSSSGSNGTLTITVPQTSSLVGSNGLSVSTNGSTISLYCAPMSQTYNLVAVTVAATRQGNSSVSLVPFDIDWPIVMSEVRVGVSISGASTTNTSSASQAVSLSVVLYTRNSDSLSSVWSGFTSTNSFWQSNSTTILAGARGLRATGVATTLYPDRYWAAIHVSTTNTGTGGNTTALGCSYSMIVGLAQATAALAFDPFTGGATNQSRGMSNGLGIYSTNNTKASYALSDAALTHTGNTNTLANVLVNLRNWSLY